MEGNFRYLQRSIKTCQRWELELGLPSPPGRTPSARVFANPRSSTLDGREIEPYPGETGRRLEEWVDAKKALRITAGALVLIAGIAVPGRLWIWHPPVDFLRNSVCSLLRSRTPWATPRSKPGGRPFPCWSPWTSSSRGLGSVNSGASSLPCKKRDCGCPGYSPEDVARIGPRSAADPSRQEA